MAIVTGVTAGQNDLEAWITAYEAQKSQKSDAEALADKLIIQAIGEFRSFATAFLGFFEQLPDAALKGKMTRSRLWARAIQAFDEYWSPLGEVATQYLLPPYRKHLEEGTALARRYLKDLGIHLPGVVVYFNKIDAIRFVPYTNVAFVAVPYSHIAHRDNADWMSIPHELGHYLYWNLATDLVTVQAKHDQILKDAEGQLRAGSQLANRAEKDISTIVKAVLGWYEEIFADVVGTKLADVEFVNSFTTLLDEVAGDVESLTINDGHHPPLCFRPFVREQVLTKHMTLLPGRDWKNVIVQQFGVNVDEIKLYLTSDDVDQQLRHLATDDLILLLTGNDDVNIRAKMPAVELHAIDAIEMLAQMADSAFSVIEDFVYVRNQSQDKTTAFDHLYERAVGLADQLKLEPYEVLLTPHIVEGGLRHRHGGSMHFQWHSDNQVGWHNH